MFDGRLSLEEINNTLVEMAKLEVEIYLYDFSEKKLETTFWTHLQEKYPNNIRYGISTRNDDPFADILNGAIGTGPRTVRTGGGVAESVIRQ